MHILIAPNAFKNGITATDAANAIKKGLGESRLSCTCTCFPVGDGGDGTATLLIQQLHGKIIVTKAHDALARKIDTSFGLIDDGKTAVIELANISGLRLLHTNEYNPLLASTFGTGELIKQALDKKTKKIIIAIGGSATVDGAIGILAALGAIFLDEGHNALEAIPENLYRLSDIDISHLDKRIFNVELIVLCDVDNALLGNRGAAAVFGPQKGADDEAVKKLELNLTRLKDIALMKTGKDMSKMKYGGAAGGTAAGLSAFLNAKLVNGIEYFLHITDFDKALQQTGLVITGEGSIDEQTLQGKAPFGVANHAKKKNIPVIGLAGKVPLQYNKQLQKYFDVLLPINEGIVDMDEALRNTANNLSRTAKAIGDIFAIGKNL